MKRKTANLILSAAIIGCFFLPLFEWHSFEMSGLNYILSSHIPSYKYVLLLIPFSALFLFVGALNNGSYLLNRKTLSLIPFFTLVFISIMRYANGNSDNSFYYSESSFSTICFGFWLMLCFSVLLMLVKDEKKTLYQYSKSQLAFFE